MVVGSCKLRISVSGFVNVFIFERFINKIHLFSEFYLYLFISLHYDKRKLWK